MSVALAVCGMLALILLARVPFCPLAGIFGIPCPGCGLSRATLALLHGNVRQALRLHPLVLILGPLFAFSVGAAAARYVRGPRARTAPSAWLASRTATVLAYALLLSTLSVWGARFLGYLGGPVPVVTFAEWARAQR